MSTITVSSMILVVCLVTNFSIIVAEVDQGKQECVRKCLAIIYTDTNSQIAKFFLCRNVGDAYPLIPPKYPLRFNVWPMTPQCPPDEYGSNLCSPDLFTFVSCLRKCDDREYSHNIIYLASYLCKNQDYVESGYGCINGRMREQEMTCSWNVDLIKKSLKDYCINVHIIRGCYLPYIKEKCGKKVIDAYVALFAFNVNLRAYGDAIFDELADKTEPDECKSLMTGSIGPIPKTTLEPTGEPTSTVIEFPTITNNDTALNSTDEEPDQDDSTPENCGPVQRAFHISGIFLGCVLTLFWTG